jgi:hypothetical protein
LTSLHVAAFNHLFSHEYLFQGIEKIGDEIKKDPLVFVAVAEALSASLTPVFETVDIEDEEVVPEWESCVDSCRSLLQNSEWCVSLGENAFAFQKPHSLRIHVF